MRLVAVLFENAGWRTAALGGASLVGLLGGGSLYVRQRTLQQHPLHVAATAQLQSSPEVRRLMESDAVSTDGFVGGYVDMIGGTAVLLLPLHAHAGVKGHARIEAEAQRVAADEQSPLGFTLGADEYRWSLRYLEVTKELPAPAPTQVLLNAPAELELPAYAPAREPALPRSLLPREAQMLLPVDLTLMRWATIHLLTIGLVARWVSRNVARQRAATALEALIQVPADPSLLELRAAALRVIAAEAPVSGSVLEAPAKIIVNTDDFYGEVLEGRDLAAYNRVTSPTGTVDLFMHATRRTDKGGTTGWRLLSSSIVDTRDTDAILIDAVDDADAARSAIRAVATRTSGRENA